MLPRLISIGDFFIPTYGVLVSAGFLLALWMIARMARRTGLPVDDVVNLGVYAALAGLLGAKLAMFLFDWSYYLTNPRELLSFSTLRAGGVFQGGLVLAVATGIWYMRRHHLPLLPTMDVFAPGIALGHAIGRVGCFAAGCCWGSECRRPWAVTFTDPHANEISGTPLGVPLHPAQLYEAFAEALIFTVLWWRFRKPHHEGQVIGLYLAMYSLARFIIEFFRFHEQGLFGGLSLTQWIALAIFLPGLWLAFRRGAEVKPRMAPAARRA